MSGQHYYQCAVCHETCPVGRLYQEELEALAGDEDGLAPLGVMCDECYYEAMRGFSDEFVAGPEAFDLLLHCSGLLTRLEAEEPVSEEAWWDL